VENGRYPPPTLKQNHNPQQSENLIMNHEITNTFEPAFMLQIELTNPLPAISTTHADPNRHYHRALALVLFYGRPVGTVELGLDRGDLSPESCAQQIWLALGSTINTRMIQEGLPRISGITINGLGRHHKAETPQKRERFLANAPQAAVIIATHNRTEGLAACLQSIMEMDYPHFEVIVVDNAPGSDETAALMQTQYGHVDRVRYVQEPFPGLAVAHNRGVQEVSAPIVAFTDDDVLVHPQWLAHIVQSFDAADNVGCVTGMIWPAELETPAQGWIEQYGGFSKGFDRQLFDLHANRPAEPLFPYTAGRFGSGANMAFKTAVLHEIGGFDPALGAGSGGVGGDDLDAFFRVIAAGYTLVYEPAALVHHWHRREYAALQRTAYGYGVGLTAYLTSCVVNKPRRLLDFALRLPAGLAYALSPKSPKNNKKDENYPHELTQLERKGMLVGPVAYLRSRHRTRHLRWDDK
jgi:O-antigen biosynthesis protein